MVSTMTGLADGGSEAAALATPFKRLLVPLDGSPLAERSLPFARALACILRGDLILVRATPAEDPTSEHDTGPLAAVEHAASYLEQLAERYQTGFAVEYSVPCGDPLAEIAKVSAIRAAELIVLTTHGAGGPGRRLLGNVVEGLARRTRLPLLIIRADLPIRRWEGGLHRVLVPLDGSQLAESVMPTVAALARAASARLTLLSVVDAPSSQPAPSGVRPAGAEDAIPAQQARAYLERVAGLWRRIGLDVQTEVVCGRAAERIAEATVQHAYDLVAMATHGRDAFDHLLVGSVADGVLATASAPVLLFRR